MNFLWKFWRLGTHDNSIRHTGCYISYRKLNVNLNKFVIIPQIYRANEWQSLTRLLVSWCL